MTKDYHPNSLELGEGWPKARNREWLRVRKGQGSLQLLEEAGRTTAVSSVKGGPGEQLELTLQGCSSSYPQVCLEWQSSQSLSWWRWKWAAQPYSSVAPPIPRATSAMSSTGFL